MGIEEQTDTSKQLVVKLQHTPIRLFGAHCTCHTKFAGIVMVQYFFEVAFVPGITPWDCLDFWATLKLCGQTHDTFSDFCMGSVYGGTHEINHLIFACKHCVVVIMKKIMNVALYKLRELHCYFSEMKMSYFMAHHGSHLWPKQTTF